MHSDFIVGVTVYLKSGSPEMTVRGIGAPIEGSGDLAGLVQCVWITDGQIVTGDFPWQCLQFAFPGSSGFKSRDLSPPHIRG